MAERGGSSTPELVRLGATVAGVAIAFVLVLVLVGHSVEEVRRTVDGFGAVAPVAFCVLMVGLTCAFFPFPVMAAAGGLLFGTAAGTALSVLGGTLGALAAFGIARRFGAAPVAGLAPQRLRRLIAAVGRRGFVAVLYLRIFPGVPRDLANYLCGLTTIAVVPYAAATLAGIAPRAFAYTALGGSFDDLRSTEAIVAVAVLAAMGLLGLVLVRGEIAAALGSRKPEPIAAAIDSRKLESGVSASGSRKLESGVSASGSSKLEPPDDVG